MCGIFAATLKQPVVASKLKGALRTMHHRGPDKYGLWQSQSGCVVLGHTRLSIIGLSNGDQPISCMESNLHIVVNGELYGYQTIRNELQSQGYKFVTDSDSEIALHLYKREGIGMLQYLRGEFAGVIADPKSNSLVAFRDRFGIKPLFYAVHNGEVLFASEIKALLAMGVPARWDYNAAYQDVFLSRPHEHSLFAGIRSVPPGHYAIAQDGIVVIYPYWEQDFPLQQDLIKDQRTDNEIIEEFRAVLSDAVRQRLVADVEVASYLSGGIDSCAVLGLAQKELSKPIRAFTLAFDHELYDESQVAEKQAAFVGADFNRIPVTSQALADAYSDAVWHAESLFVNSNSVAKFILSRAVRDKGIKVVFTGEGADEILAGYPPFRRDALLYNAAGTDTETTKKLLADMQASNKVTKGLLHTDAEPPAILDVIKRRLGWVPSWLEAWSHAGQQTTSLFRADFLDRSLCQNPYTQLLDYLPIEAMVKGRNALNQSLYMFARTHLPNFILTVLGDRMEMAHSLEGRVPFLDHRVAEFSARLPIRMKIKGIREKYVLREAVKDVIIEPVYNREKHPFMAPPAPRSETGLLELFEDTLSSKAFKEQPIYAPEAGHALLKEYKEGHSKQSIVQESILNKVVSTTLLHERFNMTA